MTANRISILTHVLLFAALCAAGAGTCLFWRTARDLAAENAALKTELRASSAAHDASVARSDRALADLKSLADRTAGELAAARAAMATNASAAARSCERLRDDLRRVEREKADLARTLEEERRRANALADREKAYSSVRSEADRKDLDELIRLTDSASRKPAASR